MTTDEWVGGPTDPDTIAPEVTRWTPVASNQTFGEGGAPVAGAPVVFTPNGDGVSDTVPVNTTVSEGSYVDLTVKNEADATVRKFTTWVPQGSAKVTWDGKTTAGALVPEGDYRLIATPKDPSGNIGASTDATVEARNTIKSAVATPAIFFNRDNDTMMTKSDFKVVLTRPAVVSWALTDLTGNVVLQPLDAVSAAAGNLPGHGTAGRTTGHGSLTASTGTPSP